MLRMVGFRVLGALPLLLLVSVCSFLLMHLMPGSPAAVMLGSRASPERIAELEAHLGLDAPLTTQFAEWITGVAQGDLGTSIQLGRPVASLVLERFPATLSLMAGGAIVAVGVGMTAGIASAVWHGSLLDRGISFFTAIGLAVPEFWVGLMLIAYFAVELDILPVISWTPPGDDLGAWAQGLVLPSIALGLPGGASIARQMRDSMLSSMNSPYVRTLAAVGTSPRTIVLRYATKNALVPVMTVIGFYIVFIFGGSFVIERVFSIPGVGSLTLDAINPRARAS